MSPQGYEADTEKLWTSFWIYFKDKSAAEDLAKAAKDDQFVTELSWSDYSKQWLVLVFYQQANHPMDFDQVWPAMERLAAKYGGFFDGWERPLFDD